MTANIEHITNTEPTVLCMFGIGRQSSTKKKNCGIIINHLKKKKKNPEVSIPLFSNVIYKIRFRIRNKEPNKSCGERGNGQHLIVNDREIKKPVFIAMCALHSQLQSYVLTHEGLLTFHFLYV